MTMHVKVGGAWKLVSQLFVKVSGSWKEVSVGSVRVGGSYKIFHSSGYPITLAASYDVVSIDSGSCLFRLGADGNIYVQASTTGGVVTDSGSDWLSPQSGMSDFEVRATTISGSLAGGTTGSWLNLGTNRDWTVALGGAWSGTLEIRRVSTTTVLGSTTLNLTYLDL